MSEPIQSIAQNNYILQGTVATSAGIAGDGSTQDPLRVVLSATNDANVNNIVVTASLPSTPDANTLYLIPEA